MCLANKLFAFCISHSASTETKPCASSVVFRYLCKSVRFIQFCRCSDQGTDRSAVYRKLNTLIRSTETRHSFGVKMEFYVTYVYLAIIMLILLVIFSSYYYFSTHIVWTVDIDPKTIYEQQEEDKIVDDLRKVGHLFCIFDPLKVLPIKNVFYLLAI